MRLVLPSTFIRYPAARRAAIALILRPSLRGPTWDLSSYETLLIKRREARGDPWSGNLACPGGKLEPGEDIVDAAVRETYEEVGLNLKWPGPPPTLYHPSQEPHIGSREADDTMASAKARRVSPWAGGVQQKTHWDAVASEAASGGASDTYYLPPGRLFQFAGRLDDRYIYARGRKVGSYVLSTAVFLSKRAETSELTLSEREIDGAFWCPLSWLSGLPLDKYGVLIYNSMLPPAVRAVDRFLGSGAGSSSGSGSVESTARSGAYLCCPSIDFPVWKLSGATKSVRTDLDPSRGEDGVAQAGLSDRQAFLHERLRSRLHPSGREGEADRPREFKGPLYVRGFASPKQTQGTGQLGAKDRPRTALRDTEAAPGIGNAADAPALSGSGAAAQSKYVAAVEAPHSSGLEPPHFRFWGLTLGVMSDFAFAARLSATRADSSSTRLQAKEHPTKLKLPDECSQLAWPSATADFRTQPLGWVALSLRFGVMEIESYLSGYGRRALSAKRAGVVAAVLLTACASLSAVAMAMLRQVQGQHRGGPSGQLPVQPMPRPDARL